MTTHLLGFADVTSGENMSPLMIKRIKPDHQSYLLVLQEQLKEILSSRERQEWTYPLCTNVGNSFQG